MNRYLPEGSLISGFQNHELISTEKGLQKALEKQIILEKKNKIFDAIRNREDLYMSTNINKINAQLYGLYKKLIIFKISVYPAPHFEQEMLNNMTCSVKYKRVKHIYNKGELRLQIF